jgi:hypothetical protein
VKAIEDDDTATTGRKGAQNKETSVSKSRINGNNNNKTRDKNKKQPLDDFSKIPRAYVSNFFLPSGVVFVFAFSRNRLFWIRSRTEDGLASFATVAPVLFVVTCQSRDFPIVSLIVCPTTVV